MTGTVDGRTARRQRTRQAIVAAVLALVRDGDLAPTARRIADRAGVSERTIFQHFADLEDLHGAAAEAHRAQVERAHQPIAANRPFQERLDAFVAQRTAVLEALTPLRRAAQAYETRSQALRDSRARWSAATADEVARVFAAELATAPAPPATARTAAAIASWAYWDELRTGAGLDAGAAAAHLRTALAAAVRPATATGTPRPPERMGHDVGVLSSTLIRRAPKVLLHDHLDGGLRPQTVIDLAAEHGITLPTTDPDDLAGWFTRGADRGSLELYLEGFAHTVAIMQTREALTRVAAECAEDLADDGVVYAEVRFAPELHIEQGLTLDEVVEAVLDGFHQGMAGRDIAIGTLITAMRTAARSPEIADLAVRWREHGVVGFDIAGAETGYPPTRHLDAFDHIRRENFHVTIHAGESFGLPSIWEAVQFCGAERLGHGVRIVDDIAWSSAAEDAKLGRLAAFVRDRRIPLEICPTSNVHTRAAATLGDHPIDLLKRLRFRVTLNTDNRLMSGVSMTSEMQAMSDTFGWTLADLQWVTINAMKSAFWPFDRRLALIDDVIKPGYAALRDDAGASA